MINSMINEGTTRPIMRRSFSAMAHISNDPEHPDRKEQLEGEKTAEGFLPKLASGPKALPVIKEHKINETSFQHASSLKPKIQANYSEMVCNSCEGKLLYVYHHCLQDQDKEIPSPHHVDEKADARRKVPPPYFELIKDPSVRRNIHFIDPGEKIARDMRSYSISSHIQKMQRLALLSKTEQEHVIDSEAPMPKDMQLVKRPNSAGFSGWLYRQTLSFKNHEIEKLRLELLDKTESEQKEVENVRRLRKALTKSMQYYIKAEEWQDQEASLLQGDIRTLKKEMSVIMACLIHSETEKMELRNIIATKDQIMAKKNNQVKDLEKYNVDTRNKLHDALKDYVLLNDKINEMSKQAESGNVQAEQRNGILQKNLEQLTVDYQEIFENFGKLKKKMVKIEEENETIVKTHDSLVKERDDLAKETEQLHQDLYSTQKEIQVFMDNETLDKQKIQQLELKLSETKDVFEKQIKEKEMDYSALKRHYDSLMVAKKEDEGTIQKINSENARLKVALKDVSQKKELLENNVKEVQELRRAEALEHDKVVNGLIEDAKIARADAAAHEEKRERTMLQMNDLQSVLDREMTQNRVVTVELERLKRDYTELKNHTKQETDKLSELKVALTNDKVALTKHVYEIRLELKEKKEEFLQLTNEYNSFQVVSKDTVESLEKKIKQHEKSIESLSDKYQNTFNNLQSTTSVHEGLMSEHQNALKRIEDQENTIKRIKQDIYNLTIYKDGIAKEKEEFKNRKEELEISLDYVNKKYSELQQSKATMEKEFLLSSQGREALIASLSNKVAELKEDIRKMTSSNTTLKDSNQRLSHDLELTRIELAETHRLKIILEEKLDEARRDHLNEKKLRFEFERMNQRLDRKFDEKYKEQVKAMETRDQKLAGFGVIIAKDYERLDQVVEIIMEDTQQCPHPESSLFVKSSFSGDLMEKISK